jgi:hypothetical protein
MDEVEMQIMQEAMTKLCSAKKMYAAPAFGISE